MKLSKLSLVLVLTILVVAALATSVSAYTSSDLATYITSEHNVGSNCYKLCDDPAQEVKDYLANNPVSDSQAEQIRNLLEQAINKASATGAIDLNQIDTETKMEIQSLIQQAGNVAGVSVSIDTVQKLVTISKNGTIIVQGHYTTDGRGGITRKITGDGGGATSSASTTSSTGTISSYVYTGATNVAFAVVAVLAVAAVSTAVVKKVNA